VWKESSEWPDRSSRKRRAGAPSEETTLQRGKVSQVDERALSSRRVPEAILATKALSHARKRGDVGLGATGMPEARLDRSARNDNTARQPDRARRSGSSVVKRPIHRPLGRENKLASHGRGASLEETPVTHERGCSSSKQLGSRSRSYLSFDRPPGGAARQTGGGRASSKVAIVSH